MNTVNTVNNNTNHLNSINISNNLTSQSLFGLFELDSTGKILYSRVESDGIFGARKVSFAGLNFYEDVATFENIGEFRKHLDRFADGEDSVGNFNFICRFCDSSEQVKVRLVRVTEREFDESAKLVIVDIRKV